jgi:hypothetical protein
LARPRGGRRLDRVGRVFADALTAAQRDWLSTAPANPRMNAVARDERYDD